MNMPYMYEDKNELLKKIDDIYNFEFDDFRRLMKENDNDLGSVNDVFLARCITLYSFIELNGLNYEYNDFVEYTDNLYEERENEKRKKIKED